MLVRDAVVPVAVIPAVVLAVSLIEVTLATCLAIGAVPPFTEVSVAVLFGTFGAYRMVAVVNSNVLRCGCAGVIDSTKRTVQGVLAAAFTSVCQAALALVLIYIPGSGGAWSALAKIVALLAPFAALIIGQVRKLAPIRALTELRAREALEPVAADPGNG